MIDATSPPAIHCPAPAKCGRNRVGLLVPDRKDASTIIVPYRGSPPDVIVGTGTSYQNGTSATSFTSTGLSAVAADERPVVAIVSRASAAQSISSAPTIGGVALTLLHSVASADGGGMGIVALYAGNLGQTGQVSVTFGQNSARTGIFLWPVKNLLGITPTDTGGSTANPLSDAMDCLAGGAIFGAAYNNAVGGFTWTGISESTDVSPGTSAQCSSAASAFASAQTALSITSDVAAEGTGRMLVLAALR